MSGIRASVAMAVYNGEKYIVEQIESILRCMSEKDELVISYDVSNDNTWNIITDYAEKDKRIRVITNKNRGVQNNFTNAVMNCKGQYIFLSDQDDVWIGDKINIVVNMFEKTSSDLVVHNGYMTNSDLSVKEKTIFDIYGRYNNPYLNIIKCNFWGCCMAFRRDVVEYVCPFPSKAKVGHDLWIGILVGFNGKISRIEDCLIKHRLHEDNVTTEKRRPFLQILNHRLNLIRLLFLRRKRGK